MDISIPSCFFFSIFRDFRCVYVPCLRFDSQLLDFSPSVKQSIP